MKFLPGTNVIDDLQVRSASDRLIRGREDIFDLTGLLQCKLYLRNQKKALISNVQIEGVKNASPYYLFDVPVLFNRLLCF